MVFFDSFDVVAVNINHAAQGRPGIVPVLYDNSRDAKTAMCVPLLLRCEDGES